MPIVSTTHETLLDGAQAHALALAMYNAVNTQQEGAMVRQASTTMVCAAMLSLGVAEIAKSNAPPPSKGDAASPSPTPPPAPAPVAAALASVAEKVPPPALAVDSGAAGMAYQSVAQSVALAVQDAADYLRNVATIASTANGVALAQLLADPAFAAQYPVAVTAIEQLMSGAVAGFEAIGAAAENLLKNFPQG